MPPPAGEKKRKTLPPLASEQSEKTLTPLVGEPKVLSLEASAPGSLVKNKPLAPTTAPSLPDNDVAIPVKGEPQEAGQPEEEEAIDEKEIMISVIFEISEQALTAAAAKYKTSKGQQNATLQTMLVTRKQRKAAGDKASPRELRAQANDDQRLEHILKTKAAAARQHAQVQENQRKEQEEKLELAKREKENDKKRREAEKMQDLLQKLRRRTMACKEEEGGGKTARKLKKTLEEVEASGCRGKDTAAAVAEAESVYREYSELARLRQLVLDLDSQTIAELKRYSDPPLQVQATMAASFLLLGCTEEEVKEWPQVQIQLNKLGKESVMRRLDNFKLAELPDSTAQATARLLSPVKGEEGVEARLGVACSAFYGWSTGLLAERNKLAHRQNQLEASQHLS